MKRTRKIRWLSLALIACVVLTALPIAGLAGSAPAIALNTDAITKGNTVYFGVMGSDPIQWRVLSGGSDSTLPVSGSGKALLISEKTLAVIQFNPDPAAADAKVWAGSNAQNWCTKFYNNWPAAAGSEKDAFLETTIAESNDETYTSSTESYNYFYQGGLYNNYYGAAPLDKERFFFLSAKEAETLFDSDGDRIPSGTSKSWWLRSPLASNAGFSGCVVPEGWVNFTRVDFTDGARPVFNLDLSAVLLVSPAEGGKSGGATLAAIGTTDTKDWKLTLKDKDRGFADNGAAAPFTAQPGGTVSIPYKNAKTGTNEYVSVLLCDGTDAKYYGSVPVAAAGGTATFTLPGDLTAGKTYTLKVFNEQKNGDKKSDYASDFVEYQLTVAAKAIPAVTSGKVWEFPKTGDSSPLGLWAGMTLFGALGIAALACTNKRKNDGK